MREIKFRAWDTKHKKWVDHAEACDFAVFGQLPRTAPIELRFLDWWKVSWYTGLKDKNGKEIYEGDIVRVVSKEWAGDDFALKLLIEWDEENLCYHAKTLDNLGRKSFYDDTVYAPRVWEKLYEVIGNIYENPDLLEGGES